MGLEILPASVTHRADGSCRNCRGLPAVEADNANPCFSSLDGVLYDKHYTKIIGCPDMKRGVVRIPASVDRINDGAFKGCDKLECVIIPEKATGVWSDSPSYWFSGEIRYEE